MQTRLHLSKQTHFRTQETAAAAEITDGHANSGGTGAPMDSSIFRGSAAC